MKSIHLKTKRLLLTPMTEAELSEKARAETDPHMRKAYEEMRAGVKSAPEQAIWYTEWRASLPDTGESIGGAGFKGPPEGGEVEIGYGIDAPHRGKGYAREAVNALCEWAFGKGAYYIIAEAEEDNLASQAVLKACGFRRGGMGVEGVRWEKEKPGTSWMATGMCLGVAMGCGLGVAFDGGRGMSLGMCFGLAIGMATGAALDAADKQKRRRRPAGEEARRKDITQEK